MLLSAVSCVLPEGFPGFGNTGGETEPEFYINGEDMYVLAPGDVITLTLTVPALRKGKELFCVVPAPTKANAVEATVKGSVGEHCPATAMRSHPGAILYLDPDSAAKL